MTCCIQKIDVTNFSRYYKGLGDNGPAKIGHVNYVLSLLSNISSGIGGTNYIYVMANGTPTENATELLTAYTTAQGLAPSSTNRITIVAGPGYYDLGATTLDMNTPCIDLVSLDGNRSILLSSTNAFGTLWVTANNVFVSGVDTTIGNPNKALCVSNNLFATTIKNCKGGFCSFGYGGDISGTFIDCEGGQSSFAGMAFSGAPMGVLDNASPPVASGTFINCVSSGGQSFGFSTMFPAAATGQFINCNGGPGFSFGASFGGAVTASGTFIDCVSGGDSFGTSFSSYTVSGTFRNCTSTGGAFGGGGTGTVSGSFTLCKASGFSFGSGGGTLLGTFYYCEIAGPATWGTVLAPTGKTIYCIDAINGPNNQGFTPQNMV